MTQAAKIARAEARMTRRRHALPHVGQPEFMPAVRRYNRAVRVFRLRQAHAGQRAS